MTFYKLHRKIGINIKIITKLIEENEMMIIQKLWHTPRSATIIFEIFIFGVAKWHCYLCMKNELYALRAALSFFFLLIYSYVQCRLLKIEFIFTAHSLCPWCTSFVFIWYFQFSFKYLLFLLFTSRSYVMIHIDVRIN